MFGKISATLVGMLMVTLVGCSTLSDLLTVKKGVVVNSTPAPVIGGVGLGIKVRTATPAPTLAPRSDDQLAEGTASVAATSAPDPCGGVIDGSRPTLRATLQNLKDGVQQWTLYDNCWGPLAWKDAQNHPGTNWDGNQEEETDYGVQFLAKGEDDGIYFRVARREYAWGGSSFARTAVFRLTRLTETSAGFSLVKRLADDSYYDGEDMAKWHEALYQQFSAAIPGGAQTDIASISLPARTFPGSVEFDTYGRSDRWAGYISAILSEPAAIRWSVDNLDLRCLQFEDMDPNTVKRKLAIGNDAGLFVTGDSAKKWCQVRRDGGSNGVEFTSMACTPEHVSNEGIWAVGKDGIYRTTLLDPDTNPEHRQLAVYSEILHRYIIWRGNYSGTIYTVTEEAINASMTPANKVVCQ